MSKDKLLTVIIPTYKRTNDLIKNLNILKDIFNQLDVVESIDILISADGSPKEHVKALENYKKESPLGITLYAQEKNLGLSGNELFLVEQVKTQFAMLLGEDDYLNANLVSSELAYIAAVKENHVSCIIPNFYGIDENGKRIRRDRNKQREDKICNTGALEELYQAHQMSGLVFRVEGLSEYYRKNAPENVYPHLIFVGYSMAQGKTVLITKNPFQNTYIKQKSFDYTYDGLTDEIIRIYNCLPFSEEKKTSAIKHFLKKDLTRYCNPKTWLHPRKFLRKVREEYVGSSDEIKAAVKKEFLLSYLKIPFIVIKHFFVRIFK